MKRSAPPNRATKSTTASQWQIDVLDLLVALLRHRLLIASVMAVAAIAGVLIASSAAPFYRASATLVLLPREKPNFDPVVMSSSIETSDDAASRSESATLTLPPNPTLYVSLIRSGAVTERVAATVAEAGFIGLSGLSIRHALAIETDEEGVMKIVAQLDDPHLAAAVVNAMVEECQEASKAIERQLILQQAGYLGAAISEAETRLVEARERIATFSERLGVADPEAAAARSAALIRTLDDAEARLQRELQAMLTHRTTLDPAAAALQRQIDDIIARRAAVQAAYCGGLSESEFSAIESEWRALQQDVTLRQDLLMSMRARHEVFSIRADQPAGSIAVISPASAPAAPAGPSRRRALVLALLAGGLLSGLGCVLADQIERARRDDAARARLDAVWACVRRPLTARPASLVSSVVEIDTMRPGHANHSEDR